MASIEDLELEVDKPSRMVLLHSATNMPIKDKQGKEAYVDVYSADSDIARKIKREIKTSRLRSRNPNALTGAKLEDEDVQLLAALTAGWYLVSPVSGEPIDLEFSRENAIKLYGNHKAQWITDQVDAHAAARGNFFKALSTNSFGTPNASSAKAEN